MASIFIYCCFSDLWTYVDWAMRENHCPWTRQPSFQTVVLQSLLTSCVGLEDRMLWKERLEQIFKRGFDPNGKLSLFHENVENKPLNRYNIHPWYHFLKGVFYGEEIFEPMESMWWPVLAVFLRYGAQARIKWTWKIVGDVHGSTAFEVEEDIEEPYFLAERTHMPTGGSLRDMVAHFGPDDMKTELLELIDKRLAEDLVVTGATAEETMDEDLVVPLQLIDNTSMVPISELELFGRSQRARSRSPTRIFSGSKTLLGRFMDVEVSASDFRFICGMVEPRICRPRQ
ncbi:hypothetical protein B0T17DRAFT_512627 [Bombardia bombarda]|uniref:Uncharacterized protein n=1 Tax=Bombardia bombarda TaxID=252184 RepID=A0AA39TJK4_9PEZI|nr:hypothetical protein B0T17DRAFT_512627 [Bombardia bombarda]